MTSGRGAHRPGLAAAAGFALVLVLLAGSSLAAPAPQVAIRAPFTSVTAYFVWGSVILGCGWEKSYPPIHWSNATGRVGFGDFASGRSCPRSLDSPYNFTVAGADSIVQLAIPMPANLSGVRQVTSHLIALAAVTFGLNAGTCQVHNVSGAYCIQLAEATLRINATVVDTTNRTTAYAGHEWRYYDRVEAVTDCTRGPCHNSSWSGAYGDPLGPLAVGVTTPMVRSHSYVLFVEIIGAASVYFAHYHATLRNGTAQVRLNTATSTTGITLKSVVIR